MPRRQPHLSTGLAALAVACLVLGAFALHLHSTGKPGAWRPVHAATTWVFGHPLAGVCRERRAIEGFLNDFCRCRPPPFDRPNLYAWLTAWEC